MMTSTVCLVISHTLYSIRTCKVMESDIENQIN